MMGFRARLHGRLPDVAGTLGAHGLGITVGGRIVPAMGYETTLLGVESRLYTIPVYIPKRVLGSHIVTRVSTIGSAGAIARLGVYRGDFTTISSGLGEADALLLDAGTISTEVVGDRLITLPSPTNLDEGFYWLALVPQGAPVTQATFLATGEAHPMINASATTPITSCTRAGATVPGALPNPVSSANRITPAPFVGLEVQAWGGG